MKDSITVSDSDKYIANVCFVSGFAFWSLVGGTILESIKKGGLQCINLYGWLAIIIAGILGVAVLFGGWYLLGYRELKNVRNR